MSDPFYQLTASGAYVKLNEGSRSLHVNGYSVARGEQEWPSTARMTVGKGKLTADVIATAFASLILISTRLANAMSAAAFTGWRSAPVRFDRDEVEPFKYQVLSVSGRCGAIKHELSSRGRRPSRMPGKMLDVAIGTCFDLESWDTSDLFMPMNSGETFITDRVRLLFGDFDMTGVEIVPLTKTERIVRVSKIEP